MRHAPRERARLEMPELLRRDVRLLGDLLGQVLREYGGPELLADVETLRRAVIAARTRRRRERGGRRARSAAGRWIAPRTSLGRSPCTSTWRTSPRSITGCGCCVRVTRRQRPGRRLARVVRRRGAASARRRATWPNCSAGCRAPGLDGASDRGSAPRGGDGDLAGQRAARPLRRPARRRRRAIRRAAADARGDRHPLAHRAPARDAVDPLDEVRTAMAVFDETLFRVVPALYRGLDHLLLGEQSGAPPREGAAVPATGQLGRRRPRRQSDRHVVRHEGGARDAGGARAAWRWSGRPTASAARSPPSTTPPAPNCARRFDAAGAEAPEHRALIEELTLRAPGEPHRVYVLYAAARIGRAGSARTRRLPAATRVGRRFAAGAGLPRQGRRRRGSRTASCST